jgi:hypothetical protein
MVFDLHLHTLEILFKPKGGCIVFGHLVNPSFHLTFDVFSYAQRIRLNLLHPLIFKLI